MRCLEPVAVTPDPYPVDRRVKWGAHYRVGGAAVRREEVIDLLLTDAAETLEALRAAAEADDRSVSSWIRRAVEHELSQRAG